MTRIHGLNQYWALNYNYTWDPTKFKHGIPNNLGKITKYKLDKKIAMAHFNYNLG